jgi:adenylylsulfate kinase
LTAIKATNIVRHEGHVSREQRESLLDQQGVLLWLTGLPSSGKSTIAYTVEHALAARGHLAYVLDGDNIRFGLNKNLGFSADDRAENIRRIGEVGKLFVDGGFLTLASFVSPYRADRDGVRALMAESDFVEIFISTPVEVCAERDPKGLYKKSTSR